MRFAGLFFAAASFAASPAVDVTFISPFGAVPGRIEGAVTGLDPATHRVAPYVFVSGLGWFSKPTCTPPTAVIDAGGRFSILFTTGGADDLATRIALFVVPSSTPVPCTLSAAGIPEAVERASVASAILHRPDPNEREIVFSGETWAVKANRLPVGPGPNLFSNRDENVFVDASGRLHLKITQREGRWRSAEVVSRRRASYGTYTFRLASSPRIDRRAVFGWFVWADGVRDSREIDFLEIGMFGRPADGTNAQYVVQPFSDPNNLRRFTLPHVPLTTHVARWEPDRIVFESYAGATTEASARIASWTYTGRVPRADSPELNVRFNLWLFDGPPSDGREVEVILQDFRYEPMTTNTSRPRASTPRIPDVAKPARCATELPRRSSISRRSARTSSARAIASASPGSRSNKSSTTQARFVGACTESQAGDSGNPDSRSSFRT